MKKFLKDTRGVVMMEYIILGLFAVAITVVGVNALGKAYNNGLLAMSAATLGSAQGANAILDSAIEMVDADAVAVATYGDELVDKKVSDYVAEGYGWAIYDGQPSSL